MRQSCDATTPDIGQPSVFCDLKYKLTDQPPAISATVSPSPTYDTSGRPWNNSPVVTVQFTCSDPDDPTSSLNCPLPQWLSNEGANQVLPLKSTVTDPNGTSTDFDPNFRVNIDQTAPTVSTTLSPSNADISYVNTDVLITIRATDALSKINPALSQLIVDGTPIYGLSPLTLTADGQHKVTAFAVDYAANRS